MPSARREGGKLFCIHMGVVAPMTLSHGHSMAIEPESFVVWSKGRSLPSQTSVRKETSPLSSGRRKVPSSLIEQVSGDMGILTSMPVPLRYSLYSNADSNFFARPCQVIESGPKWIPGTLRKRLNPMLSVVDFATIPGGPTK